MAENYIAVGEIPSHNHKSPEEALGYFAGWGDKSGNGWVTQSTENTGGNWFTQNTGGNGFHNNISKSKAAYIWQRTA